MRRTVVLLALLVCLFAVALAHAQIEGSVYPALKVGSVGHFLHSKDGYWKTKVVEVIDKETMLVTVGPGPAFLVKKYPTKGLADDELVELRGQWKVTGTEKHQGKTYKVVEPHEKKE